MSIRIAFATSSMVLVMTQAASAAMVTFTNSVLWSGFSNSQGASVVTETFNAYDGYQPSGLSSTIGGIQWTASAPEGLFADLGYLSTNASGATMTFSLSPSVQGVSGNFFGTDIQFALVPAIISVQLGDGSAYVGYSASVADFVGFYSTGSAIASISVSVANVTGTESAYATVDNLYFAVVPAPGAIALLGVACLVGRRRRRA